MKHIYEDEEVVDQDVHTEEHDEDDEDEVDDTIFVNFEDPDYGCDEIVNSDTSKWWASAGFSITIGDHEFKGLGMSGSILGGAWCTASYGSTWGDDGGDPGYSIFDATIDGCAADFNDGCPDWDNVSFPSDEVEEEFFDLIEALGLDDTEVLEQIVEEFPYISDSEDDIEA